MARRSALMNWPANLIGVTPCAYSYVEGGGHRTQRSNSERSPIIVQRLYMEFEMET